MKLNIKQLLPTILTPALLFLSFGYCENMSGHDHSMHQKKSDSHAKHQMAPKVDNELLGVFYENYLGIQAALAGDDLKAAKKEALKFDNVIDSLKKAGKKDFAEKLDNIVTDLGKAKDIGAARDNFIHLSMLTISLLEHNKYQGDKKAFVYHCPMAAGGKGADWLQSAEGTKNPYYGKKMLACGSKTKAIHK